MWVLKNPERALCRRKMAINHYILISFVSMVNLLIPFMLSIPNKYNFLLFDMAVFYVLRFYSAP